MRPFRNLIAWQKAHDLTLDIWKATAAFPAEERFVLVPQMRRAARSIPANLAEGSGRRTTRAFVHYVDIACGSSSELEYDLFLSRELGIMEATRHADLHQRVVEVRKMMLGLARPGGP